MVVKRLDEESGHFQRIKDILPEFILDHLEIEKRHSTMRLDQQKLNDYFLE